MLTFVILFVMLIVLICVYFKWCYGYWNRRNVVNIPGKIPFGNISSLFNPSNPIHIDVANFYNLIKAKKAKYGGFYLFNNPVFVPVDLDLLRMILSVDYNHFNDRGLYIVEDNHPLSANLFALPGQRWRILRAKLTPTFTSGKIKNMFFIMLESGRNMLKYIDEEILAKDMPLNVKQTMSCLTTDVIGSAAFGLECNCFQEINSPFCYHANKVFKGSTWDNIRSIIVYIWPKFANKLGLSTYNKEVTTFFTEFIKKSVDYREQSRVIRKDFMQLLIDMKNSEEQTLTFNELAAQCFLFFVAGFESSSLTMTFVLYEMSLNMNIQKRAREELLTVLEKYDGEITYDAIMELKYLQQVVDEVLRKYPPLPILHRRVTETYKIPGSDLVLEEGAILFIPVHALHYDSDYFPDPEKFDPERFSDEEKPKIKRGCYLPFGDGPRNCIGLRFGLLQTKTGLAMLLKNYTITLNPLTKVPIELNPFAFITASKYDILLNLQKIS